MRIMNISAKKNGSTIVIVGEVEKNGIRYRFKGTSRGGRINWVTYIKEPGKRVRVSSKLVLPRGINKDSLLALLKRKYRWLIGLN